MSPINYFKEVWSRCDQLSALHAYLSANATSVLPLDELLRAEWVARVSALDMYIHELVAQKIMDIYKGSRPATPSYLQFKISTETFSRIRSALISTDAASAFELDIKSSLARITYQDQETIADGVRLISEVELWNELAIIIKNPSPSNKIISAKDIKKDLSLIVSNYFFLLSPVWSSHAVPLWPLTDTLTDDLMQKIRDLGAFESLKVL